MKLTIKNIGKIKNAEIEFSGLTVIGGYNDIGKSTIGKTIFSIIKTIQNSEEEYVAGKQEEIEQIVSELNVNLRKSLGTPANFFTPLRMISRRTKDILYSGSMDTDEINKVLTPIMEEIIDTIKRSPFNRIDKSLFDEKDLITTYISSSFKRINEVISQDVNQTKKFEKAFNRTNKSIFVDEINNKYDLSGGSITCLENETPILEISVSHSNNTVFNFHSENFLFNDVTLIESPSILSMSFLTRISSGGPSTLMRNEISYPILDLIKGEISYNDAIEDFIFERTDSIKVKSVNIASGAKAFGIIQLLINAGAVNSSSLLIIDEPEVHLHPEWQLKYAEIIASLVNSGIFVLVSSHSPYMIEALKHYSDKFQLSKITRFYLGKDSEGGSLFNDITDNLEPLYNQLAVPMQRLSFE
jgi:predicted ATP-dependent endonuclease of OLD family